MRLISDFNWKDELKLTGSFLLNRIVPILVFFIAFLLVLKLGTQEEIDTYSLYSSLFSTFLTFGLSMVTGVRFYATQLSHEQMFVPMTNLAVGLGIFVAITYLVYIYWFIDSHLYNIILAIAFAFTIIISFCYQFFVVYGESRKMVLGSDISNKFSLIFFLFVFSFFYFLFIPNPVSLINGITISYALSEFVIFIILINFILRNQDLFRGEHADNNSNLYSSGASVIVSIVSFSMPIVVLNFLKKASQTQALLSLSNTSGAMGILQTIFMASILLATFSSAFSNNGFIALAKENKKWRDESWEIVKSYICYCTILIFLLLTMCAIVIFMIIFGFKNSTQPFIIFVKSYPFLMFLFVSFEIVIWSILIYARALGDAFRVQSFYLFGLLLAGCLIGFLFEITLLSVVMIFLMANVIGCAFGGFWVYKTIYQKIKQAKHGA